MKLLFTAIAILLVTGCTRETSFGTCVGVADKKDPALTYHLSYWNVAVAVVFSETLVVPAVVVAKDLECPYGRKP